MSPDHNPAEQPLGDMLDLLAALLAVGLLVLSYGGRSGLPLVLFALGFTFFVPGRAIITNWPGLARWSEAAMSMIFSLAVLVLLSTVTLWAHFWHPQALFQVVAWLSLAALGAGAYRRRTRRPVQGADAPDSVSRGSVQ